MTTSQKSSQASSWINGEVGHSPTRQAHRSNLNLNIAVLHQAHPISKANKARSCWNENTMTSQLKPLQEKESRWMKEGWAGDGEDRKVILHVAARI